MIALLFALGLAADGRQAPPPPPPQPQRIEVMQPPRDPGRRLPPEPTGTGIIRGQVVAADTGTPIRRATVTLVMTSPPPVTTPATMAGGTNSATGTVIINGVPTAGGVIRGSMRPKTVTTDAQGAFAFSGLPPGSYRVMASPGQYAAAYLSMSFGARRPNGPPVADPGTPIQLADGQVFNKAAVALMRGGVITGRVTDENGEPLARVQVYPTLMPGGAARGMRIGGTVSTDDLGQFRMFGLLPGEFLVVAEARMNSFVPPNAPPETEEDRIGFVTTFFPNTADEASAQRVRVRTGTETAGVEIRMVAGRLFHVTGVVMDSKGRFGARVNGQLMKRSAGNFVMSSYGFSTDEQGRFQMRNVAPGTYRLTVRQQGPAMRNDDGSMTEQGEFASIPLSIVSDVENILVTTSTGATIAGTVVFEDGPPQLGQSSFQMRVSAQPGEPDNMMGVPMPQPALVTPDLTFTMKGLAGEVLLRSSGPNVSLKAVMAGAEDVTDTPREFKTGDRVTIVMTSRAGVLEGIVSDAAGKPAMDTAVLLFSDDKAFWRVSSIRTRRGGSDQAGRYRLTGLLPGRYILVAMPRERMTAFGPLTDPATFEALAREGTTVVIGENEQRQVDMKVSTGGGAY